MSYYYILFVSNQFYKEPKFRSKNVYQEKLHKQNIYTMVTTRVQVKHVK